MEAYQEQLFNNIKRNFVFIEHLILHEEVLETHIRTLTELARLLEETSLRLITNHEDEDEEDKISCLHNPQQKSFTYCSIIFLIL